MLECVMDVDAAPMHPQGMHFGAGQPIREMSGVLQTAHTDTHTNTHTANVHMQSVTY